MWGFFITSRAAMVGIGVVVLLGVGGVMFSSVFAPDEPVMSSSTASAWNQGMSLLDEVFSELDKGSLGLNLNHRAAGEPAHPVIAAHEPVGILGAEIQRPKPPARR